MNLATAIFVSPSDPSGSMRHEQTPAILPWHQGPAKCDYVYMYSEVGTIHASGERTQPNDVVLRLRSPASHHPRHAGLRFFVHHVQKFWGTRETLLPVYTSLAEAIKKYPDVDGVVNFASSLSVYSRLSLMLEKYVIFGIYLAGGVVMPGKEIPDLSETFHRSFNFNFF
ncbi:hypothetical protein BU15DRAFT_64884 [Melanogaster broomeanus]|nr:hypothetical protein BU15DRAFT_64884 [Melanogaster broomeanus]